MPTLVGFTANKLILNSSNFRREIVGLERINDVYTSRTEDAEFFQELIINGATHKTITGYFNPVPPSAERYSTMLVENAESTNEPGGITRYNVTYVGLFRDLKPKPIIAYQPIDTYAFNPFGLTIEFVEGIGEVGSFEEINFLKKYSRRSSLPRQINGYQMPTSPVAPFVGQIDTKLLPIIEGSPFFQSPLNSYFAVETLKESFNRSNIETANQGFSFPFIADAPPPQVIYRGLIISGLSYQRYGNFAHGIISASDSAYFSYVVSPGTENARVIENRLNFEF